MEMGGVGGGVRSTWDVFRNEKKIWGGNCRGERFFRFASIYFPENTSLYLCVVCTIFGKNRPHFCAFLQSEKSLQKPLAICFCLW